MIPVSSWTGLAGCALLLVSLIMHAGRTRRYPAPFRMAIFVLAWIAAFLPVKGLPVAGYIRGVTGDLSITTLVLFSILTLSQLSDRDLCRPRSLLPLMVVVSTGGLFLYPLALGLTYFDPYALGYNSKVFSALLFCVALAAWYFRFHLLLFCVILGVTGYLVGINESRNLWDYLLDPLVTCYAFFWLAITIAKHRLFWSEPRKAGEVKRY